MTKKLSIATAALVLLLSLGGFVLSYNALWDMAYKFGTFPRLSFIWPLLIDFALVVFSIAVFRASVLGERVGWAWMLVGLFTIATIAINVLHVWAFLPELAVKIIVAAVPPVALFLSFETFIDMAKKEYDRSGLVNKLATLKEQLETTRNEMEVALSKQETLNGKLVSARAELVEIEKRIAEGKKAPSTEIEQRRLRVLEMARNKKTHKEMAEVEGVSIKTIALDIKALNGKVKA